MKCAPFADGKGGVERIRCPCAIGPWCRAIDRLAAEAGDGTTAIIRALEIQHDVIILSAGVRLGAVAALEARQFGAVDVIAKPSGSVGFDLEAKRGHVQLKALHAAARSARGPDHPHALKLHRLVLVVLTLEANDARCPRPRRLADLCREPGAL